jgi:hypothetical protein
LFAFEFNKSLMFHCLPSQDLMNQIEDLKAQLRVSNLQLKDKEFKFSKSKEDYEFQIAKLFDENKSLKQKYEK